MCGLFGAISGRGAPDLNIIKMLGTLNQERGEDSCGLAFGHSLVKGVGTEAKWTNFIKTNKIEFKAQDHVVIGHVRKKTQGLATEKNAHPFKVPISYVPKEDKDKKKDYCIIGAHNGNITNWRDMCREKGLDPVNYDVDSHAVMALIGTTFRAGNYKFFTKYEGKAALMWTFSDEEAIYVFHGKSIENNYGMRFDVSEERPLHYWVDTKKNVTYFSSEAGPLEAIATDNEEVKSVPFNQIIKFTSNTMEVIAEIPRDTEGYQFFTTSQVRSSSAVTPNRKIDNNDFFKNRSRNMSAEIPFKIGQQSIMEGNMVVLPSDLLTKSEYSVKYEAFLELFNLEDRDELKYPEEALVNIKSRYYRNGHLMNGIVYISQTGKVSTKKVSKKELTISIREDGKNVQYSKYHFKDGLLFFGESDYLKYDRLVRKGVGAQESQLPMVDKKPRLAHADFIKRVVASGIKFLAPVSDLALTSAHIYLPPAYSKYSANDVITVDIPFSGTKYVVKGNQLMGVIRADKKTVYVDKGKVIFSVDTKREEKVKTRDVKDLDIIELFEDTEINGATTSAKKIPWQKIVLDYETQLGYYFDDAANMFKCVLSFWVVSKGDYHNTKKSYLCPIQWVESSFDTSIEDINFRLGQIQADKVKYNAVKESFFGEIDYYNETEPFNIKNARDISRLIKVNGLTTHDVDELSSYTEVVNDNAENTTPVIGKQFLDLCQIAGRPKNQKASEEIAKNFFIDWHNQLIWEPIVDPRSDDTVSLFKSYHFNLKQHVYDTKPIMLTKIREDDPFYVNLTTEEFVDHLRKSSLTTNNTKDYMIAALISRGFTIIGELNDYDAMLEEMNVRKYETVDSYEAPINGNDKLADDADYINQKIKEENDKDALQLRTSLKKDINALAGLISGNVTKINEFLRIHGTNYSIKDAGLTEYMNVFQTLQSKIRLFNVPVNTVAAKSLKDLPNVFKVLIESKESIKKLAKRYLYTTDTKNGDIITADGFILRSVVVLGNAEPVYTHIGTWEARIENDEIIPVFHVNKGINKTIPLEDIGLYTENTLTRIIAKHTNLLIINNNDIITWRQLKKGTDYHSEMEKTML